MRAPRRSAPRLVALLAMVLALTGFLAACGGSGTGTVVSIVITKVPSPPEVAVGASVDLDAVVTVTGGASQAVTWSSSDAAHATVDGNGTVTGVAAGSVTITAASTAAPSIQDHVTLSVTNPGNRRPTADAGLDATVVADPGGSVSLDGSGSSDPDGDPLTFSWTLTSAPSGSAAALTGAATATPQFTADLAGDYAFSLEVSDGSLTNTDTVTVHAECPAPIEISANLTADDTWGVNVRNCADYVVTKSIQVKAVLTIQPGTHVQMASAAVLWAPPADGGAIHAVGTATDPILIDGTNATPGYWKTLQFGTANPLNELTHVIVDGGGQPLTGVPGALVVVSNNGSLTITHSVLRRSYQYGVLVTDGTTENALHDFADNRFEGNAAGPLNVPASALRGLDAASAYDPAGSPNGEAFVTVRRGFLTTLDATWPAIDVPYRFTSYAQLNTHLVIEPGAVLEFANANAYLTGLAGSVTDAQGTAAQPITFRGTVAGQGTWGGLRFQSGTTNTLDHVSVSGGGSDGNGDVWAKNAGTVVALTNSSISDSGGFGVLTTSGGAFSPADPTSAAAANTFNNNLKGDVGP